MTPEQPIRPTVDVGGVAARDARAAVDRLVAELQAGLDAADAEISNRHFVADVIWGGPFGATVAGYEQLHSIHTQLKRERRAGPSRYVVERVLTPRAGVAVAQVRRDAINQHGQALDPAKGFSEVAMYVLVERDGDWWLIAGQNTPVRPGMSATDR
jgi:uncharacterized protein (TIGR02246 family)